MDIVNRFKSWLVFTRAHTVILEAPMAALGASLALGTFWHVGVLKWTLFGALYHLTGYGMNSYSDWKNGYDKNDPNKEHHPLNTGEIKPNTAKLAVYTLTGSLLAYGLHLTQLRIESLVVLALMILLGVAYNYLGKTIQHKYVLVSGVHTLVFVLPYVTYTDSYANIVWIGALAYFVHHIFQILISGDVKDVEMDESSLIQELGMRIEYVDGMKLLDVDPSVVVISYIVSILEGIIVIGILLFFEPSTIVSGLTMIMFGWMMLEVDGVISEGLYDRSQRVSAMSRKEIAGLWMIFCSFTGQLSILSFAVMAVASMTYFIPVSLFMWGGLKPDV